MKYVKVQRKFERSCPPFKRIFSEAKEFIYYSVSMTLNNFNFNKGKEEENERMNEFIVNYREKHTYITQHLLRSVWVPFSC